MKAITVLESFEYVDCDGQKKRYQAGTDNIISERGALAVIEKGWAKLAQPKPEPEDEAPADDVEAEAVPERPKRGRK